MIMEKDSNERIAVLGGYMPEEYKHHFRKSWWKQIISNRKIELLHPRFEWNTNHKKNYMKSKTHQISHTTF